MWNSEADSPFNITTAIYLNRAQQGILINVALTFNLVANFMFNYAKNTKLNYTFLCSLFFLQNIGDAKFFEHLFSLLFKIIYNILFHIRYFYVIYTNSLRFINYYIVFI